jgi:FkbM family methyltransferase
MTLFTNLLRTTFSLAFLSCALCVSSSFATSEEVDVGTARLQQIHSKLQLIHGSLHEEYPEQLMAATFISSDSKVLELGGNVGRNSCVIALLLNSSRNLVVVESDPKSTQKLKENRNHNNLSFYIENSAISKVPLIQSGWDTKPGTIAPPGYYNVKTITYSQLKAKYQVPFDTLVADCEGALYYILRDDETMLKDFKTLIVENDYRDRGHYEYVCSRFVAAGFKPVYTRAGGWQPCYNEFYQVWQKR